MPWFKRLLPLSMILLSAGPALAQTITNITPGYGGAGPNAVGVTITGTGFSITPKATRFVDVNNADILAGVTCSSTTSCTASGSRPFRVPAGSVQTLQVYAMVNGVRSATHVGFIYYGELTISSLAPDTGVWDAATAYTINGGPFTSTGTGFPGMTSIYLGPSISDRPAGCGTISACAATAPSLTYDCCVPQGAMTVDIRTVGGTAAPFFIYGDAPATPTVTSVSQASGPASGGHTVSITGTNFVPGPNSVYGDGFNVTVGTTFTFISRGSFGSSNTATGVNCESTTACTVVVPAGNPGIVDVQVFTVCEPSSAVCGGANVRPSVSVPTTRTGAYAYAGLRLTPGNAGTLSTSENGQSAQYSVALYSRPSANVHVTLTTSGGGGSLSTSGLDFTPSNWAAPQTVTITGLEDSGATGNIGYSVQNVASSTDLTYNTAHADQQFTNLDNETKGFFIAPQSGLVTTRTGGTATFTVVLLKAPSATVTVDLASNDPLAGIASPASLTFATSSGGATGWDVPRSIAVTGQNDGSPGRIRDYSILVTSVSADTTYGDPSVLYPPDVQLANIDSPTAPTGLTVVRTGSTTASANWTAVGDAIFYKVKYSFTAGGTKTTLVTTGTPGHALTGLTQGQQYFFVVSSTNAAGESADSPEVSFVIPLPGPAGDFDGDAKADMTLYKINGDWAILNSSGGYTSSTIVNRGGAGYTAVPGDYDGDGRQDVAVYRDATGEWTVLTSSTGFTAVVNINWGGAGYLPVPGDYDGDGKTDFAVYRPSTGQWSVLQSSANYTTTIGLSWGGESYTAVPGQDFDGDGRSDAAVYQSSTGFWYVLKSSTSYTTTLAVSWGGRGYSLVPGDYDGDRKTDLGLYQRATGWWYILKSDAGYTTTLSVNWGGAGYVPVPGDYDGDARFDLGIFQPSTGAWSVLRSTANYTTVLAVTGWGSGSDRPVTSAINTGGSDLTRASDFDADDRSEITIYNTVSGVWSSLTSSTNYSGATTVGWGGAGYTPAPGDFDGDGKADLAIYQESSGNWSVLLSSTGFTTTLAKGAGGPGWTPVPGDYDGDGKTDFAAYHTTTGQWFVLKSSTAYTTAMSASWGGTGYTPTPGDFDGDGKTDLGLYQGSTGNWSVLLSASGYTTSLTQSAGGAGYVAVQGDYDGDGKTDFVVYNTTTGLWYGLKSSSNYTTTVNVGWGGTGYVPVKGDYDADGRTDLATYQTATGTWYILLSGAGYTTSLSKSWGGGGDIPLPSYP